MSSTFTATEAVKSTNKKLAKHNSKVVDQLRGVATAPHFMKDAKGHHTFPAPYVDSSLGKQADRLQVKQKLAEKAGDANAWYNTVPLTEEDVEFVIRQSELEELVNYDRQFLALIDVTSAAELDKFKQIYPDFFTKRKEYMKQIIKMQVALAKIALMGVQTKADLDLIINIQALDDGGVALMKLLAIPAHYLVMASSDNFLHATDVGKFAPVGQTGTPKAWGAHNVGYKDPTYKNNLNRAGAGFYPAVDRNARNADGTADAPRVDAYGRAVNARSRGAFQTDNTRQSFLSDLLTSAGLK